jgi:hypothetical protein
MAIEVLQGNDLEALTHMQNGLAILKSLYAQSCQALRGLPQSIDDDSCMREKDGLEICVQSPKTEYLDELLAAFCRLEIQVSSFSLRYRSQCFYIPCLPRQLWNIFGARNSLDTIISHMHYFLRLHAQRHKTLPYHPLPSEVLQATSDFQNLLFRWKDTFDSFFKTLTIAERSLITSSKVLLIFSMQQLGSQYPHTSTATKSFMTSSTRHSMTSSISLIRLLIALVRLPIPLSRSMSALSNHSFLQLANAEIQLSDAAQLINYLGVDKKVYMMDVFLQPWLDG